MICMCGHTYDVVIYSKFHRNLFRCFGAPGGQNLPFPITLAIGLYNSSYYHTSRDDDAGKDSDAVYAVADQDQVSVTSSDD